MPTMYRRSSGEEVAIETMEFHHLKPALAKLLRERKGEERQVEIDAMTKRMEVLEAERAAETEGVGANAGPDEAALMAANELAFIAIDDARNAAEDANPRAVIGGNAPPITRPFDLIREHMDDLLIEAHNWADGTKVETQAQVDEINRLKDDLRKAFAAAEAEKEKEKGPLDLAAAEIQNRYNVYLAPTKNKGVKGKIPVAIEALSAAQTPYLLKLENEKRAVAEAARKEAEAKAAAAAEAVRQAQASDLTARESAEDLIAEAEAAAATAKRAEADKAQAHGGVRSTGLRSYWKASVTDTRAVLLHYINERRSEFDAIAARMAQQDVDAGRRQLPGVEVVEERRVA